MNPETSQVQAFPRVPTGIEGLDELLNGGYLQGGVWLLLGPPGVGKTILANQIGFNCIKTGGNAVYFTLLAESQQRLFSHLKSLDFFDEAAIARSFNYFGAYSVLAKEGVDGLLRLIAEVVRKNRPSVLFIDGIAAAEDIAQTPAVFKKFAHELNTITCTAGCTVFMLSSHEGDYLAPEHTTVDGIISMHLQVAGTCTYREIEVRKFRGSSHKMGRHAFKISDEGIEIFPRAESTMGSRPKQSGGPESRKTFGIAKLDELLDGGVTEGSITSLIGAGGTGKSVLALNFLVCGAKHGEPGLFFSFYEKPERLIEKVERLGIPARQAVEKGTLFVLWQPPLEILVDEVFRKILKTIKEKNIRRLMFDGIGGLASGMVDPKRLVAAFSAFANELRTLGVTTIYSEETRLFSSDVRAIVSDQSATTDNVMYLRQVELNSSVSRFLAIIKTRESDADRRIYEISIGKGGIRIGDPLEDFEQLLTGTPKYRPGGKK